MTSLFPIVGAFVCWPDTMHNQEVTHITACSCANGSAIVILLSTAVLKASSPSWDTPKLVALLAVQQAHRKTAMFQYVPPLKAPPPKTSNSRTEGFFHPALSTAARPSDPLNFSCNDILHSPSTASSISMTVKFLTGNTRRQSSYSRFVSEFSKTFNHLARG